MSTHHFSRLLTQPEMGQPFELHENVILETDADGIITDWRNGPADICDSSSEVLALPGLINSHSHAYQVMMRGKADHPAHFRDWVNRHLYPTVEAMTAKDYRKWTRFFYSQCLRHGIIAVGEFHYFHHLDDADAGDRIILESAADVGIRLGLLQSAYDQTTRAAQQRFLQPIDGFYDRLNDLDAEISEYHPLVELSVAPHSLHGCSADLIRESVEWALEFGVHWHIHLAEQSHDLEYSIQKYGKRPLDALVEILGDKLDELACIVHGVWIHPEEFNHVRERSLNLIYNPLTNMYLGDGVTDVPAWLSGGGLMGLGTDSNNTFNMFQEARIAELLQRVSAHEMGQLDHHRLLAAATSEGARLINIKSGILKPGYPLDVIEIDINAMAGRPLADMDVDEVISHLIYSGVDPTHLKRIRIAGVERHAD